MKKLFFVLFLYAVIWLAAVTTAPAAPGQENECQKGHGQFCLLHLDLSSDQINSILTLRKIHEKEVAPLKIQERRMQAELHIFWLQMTPDPNKIKSLHKQMHDIKFQLLEKETDLRIAIRNILTTDQLAQYLAMGGVRRSRPEKTDHPPPRHHKFNDLQ